MFANQELVAVIAVLVVMIAGLAVAWVPIRHGNPTLGAAFLIGLGGAWAARNWEAFRICTYRDALLYRPCTGVEIGVMVVPPIVLLSVGLGMLVRSRHQARPRSDTAGTGRAW